MSIVMLGVRVAALAFVLVLASASPATAANPFQFTCYLNPNDICLGSERHTYDDQLAIASRDDAYIASWFINPATGNAVSVIFGWGVSGGDYRFNNDLWLDPWVGNFSAYQNLKIDGYFTY